MKIGIFDPYLDTLSGGEKYMLSIATCLSSSNDVFVFWDQKQEKIIREEAYNKLGIDLSKVLFYPNIFSSNISLLSRAFASRKFDAIIYLSDGSIPFVLTKLYIHFQFPVEWVYEESLKQKAKLFFVKRIFCNSNFTKSFIDRKFGTNSDVLYPPVAISGIKKEKKENLILHVGRFDQNNNGANYKKQDIMIGVFKQMIDEGLRNWKLVVITGVKKEDYSKFNKLKKMCVGYPIEVIDNPTNTDLWKWYSKAKIYWHATGFGEDLVKYPEKAEHFGISTVEAMALGAVPVVINKGGQKEIVVNEKSGYTWNTLEDFARKTNILINDVGLWEEMSKEATKRAQIFTGDRFCKELEKIIK